MGWEIYNKVDAIKRQGVRRAKSGYTSARGLDEELLIGGVAGPAAKSCPDGVCPQSPSSGNPQSRTQNPALITCAYPPPGHRSAVAASSRHYEHQTWRKQGSRGSHSPEGRKLGRFGRNRCPQKQLCPDQYWYEEYQQGLPWIQRVTQANPSRYQLAQVQDQQRCSNNQSESEQNSW